MRIKRTLRERKFIKSYIDNFGNATKAYMDLHPNCSKKSAGDLGYRMLKKVDISITELLEIMGTTDAYLNQKLNDGLDATKVISVIPIPPKEANPGTGDLPDANSKNVDFIDVPDYNVRFKYLDMAYKLKDKYPSEKHDVNLKGELKITNARQKFADRIAHIAARTKENKTT